MALGWIQNELKMGGKGIAAWDATRFILNIDWILDSKLRYELLFALLLLLVSVFVLEMADVADVATVAVAAVDGEQKDAGDGGSGGSGGGGDWWRGPVMLVLISTGWLTDSGNEATNDDGSVDC